MSSNNEVKNQTEPNVTALGQETCPNCNKTVFAFFSKKKSKKYYCNSSNPRDFHNHGFKAPDLAQKAQEEEEEKFKKLHERISALQLKFIELQERVAILELRTAPVQAIDSSSTTTVKSVGEKPKKKGDQ